MGYLDPSLITGGGVVACLAVLFTALWRGWLWTGPQVAKLEKQYNQSLEQERERTSEWRGIALKAMANADKIGPQLDAILATSATNQALLGALREKAGHS
jgi:type II secretory pathway component PulM